ncbi:PrsW family intramembrane metalloprotease [Tamaricihabitans halophyticus]|uniref:PrsW family intramembrane metalloprotease n=1 Tax=Tamaricihabitans halophyticus TaxID=1262583 RepID=UPI001047DE15|nr:PrsW family intramembrane metalloprotease [Tamaricihabitans halophyticus]
MLLPIIGLVLLALCGLVLLALGTLHFGGLALTVGVVLALLPVTVVVGAFLWVDRWEPEPAKLLMLAFTWGACVAALTALLINNTAELVGDQLLGRGSGNTVSAVLSAPLVEETLKGAFLVGILLWRRKEFDGVVDGIVYAGFTSAGFAFTENIYYFGRIFTEEGIGDWTGNGVLVAFIARAVLSPFTHPLFTALLGIGLGIAARTRSTKLAVFVSLAGFVGSVGLHALWNAAATLGGSEVFLNVYFLVMVPILAGLVVLVNWHRRREQRIVASAIPELVEARLVAESEAELLTSLPERRRWRRQAKAESGKAAAIAVGNYQSAVTELAFLRSHESSGLDEATAGQRQTELVAAVRKARADAVRSSFAYQRGRSPG